MSEPEMPRYKCQVREIWEDGELKEVIPTIEIPFKEYIELIEKKKYNSGFSDGMLSAIQELRGSEG